MADLKSLKITGYNTWAMIRYNMKIVFGGRFLYFIVASFLVFIIIGALVAFDANYVNAEDIYNILLFPAILLAFYPTVFGIQNDADQRTLEIIFGIPDYRYKVWLVRLFIILAVVAIILVPYAFIAHYTLVSFAIGKMVLQTMVVVVFMSFLSFFVSTAARNGYATAVIVIIIGLLMLIFYDAIEDIKWNILLNPFRSPTYINEIIWAETIRQNRIILGIASIVFLLLGLLGLQKREKFLK